MRPPTCKTTIAMRKRVHFCCTVSSQFARRRRKDNIFSRLISLGLSIILNQYSNLRIWATLRKTYELWFLLMLAAFDWGRKVDIISENCIHFYHICCFDRTDIIVKKDIQKRSSNIIFKWYYKEIIVIRDKYVLDGCVNKYSFLCICQDAILDKSNLSFLINIFILTLLIWRSIRKITVYLWR